jgi:hypothetical protein
VNVCLRNSERLPISVLGGVLVPKFTYEQVSDFCLKFHKKNGRYPRRSEVIELMKASETVITGNLIRFWKNVGHTPSFDEMMTSDQLKFWLAIGGEWTGDYAAIVEKTGFNRTKVINLRTALIKMGVLDYARPETGKADKYADKKTAQQRPRLSTQYVKVLEGKYAGLSGMVIRKMDKDVYFVLLYPNNGKETAALKYKAKELEFARPFYDIVESLKSTSSTRGIPRWGRNYREC